MSDRVLYLDLVGGVAGDMLLGALFDLGAPIDRVREAMAAMELDHVELRTETVHPAGLRAMQVDVMVRGVLADSETEEGAPVAVTADGPHGHHAHPHGGNHRPWRHIRGLLDRIELPVRARRIAQGAFRRLAEAESRAHGVPIEDVVFHEVGADDALVDVVGVAVAFDALEVDRAVASPLPMGRGMGRGAHGPFPVPAPAVLEILRGAPLASTPIESEMVTPTGAALVQTLVDSYGPLPDMQALLGTGVGAGHKRWPDRPNVVRCLLGEAGSALPNKEADCVELAVNLDDMNPEHLGPLMEAALRAGAVDTWAQSATFKKGRVGLVVSALAPRAAEPAVARALLRHSPSLGLRVKSVERRRLGRRRETVSTRFGEIRVKVSDRPDGPPHIKPEHDDVRAAAEAADVGLREVEAEVWRAYQARED